MALTKITPQMFDTSATAHDLNVDNGTFVVDGSASRVGIGTATPSTLLDVNGALTATTIAGTLTTAAQANITSLGTLSALTISGDLTVDTSTLKVDSSNNSVGIGTTSPSTTLEIRRDVAASADLDAPSVKLYNNSDGGSAIEFSNGVSGKSKISFGVEGTGASTDETFLGFSTGANGGLSERMRIDSGGNVSILTSGVALAAPVLQVTNANVATYTGTTPAIHSPASATMAFSMGGAERMRIDSSGRVGIGNTSPAQSLHVGSSSSGTSSNGIRIEQNEGAFDLRVDAGEFYLYDVTDSRIPFLIDTSGKVGIGTSSPAHSLHVRGPVSNTGGVIGVFDGTDSTNTYIQVKNSNSGYSWQIGATNAGVRFYNDVTSSHALGISGTGAVEAGAGSASLPSLSFLSDTNTGIYSVAADNIGFATGGVARGFWSATQFNVTGNGVFSGTGSFGGNLSVTGQGDFSTVVLVGTQNSEFAENNLRFRSGGHAYIDHMTTGQDFVFRTSSSSSLDRTAFTIDSSGSSTFSHHLGVRTFTRGDGGAFAYSLTMSADNSGNAIEIFRTNNSKMLQYMSADGKYYFDMNGSSTPEIRFRNNGTDWMRTQGTHLFVGGSAPQTKGAETSASGTGSNQTILQVQGAVDMGYQGRYTHGLWGPTTVSSSGRYTHLKTAMWGGGSPYGNFDYIMGGFLITGYRYSTTANHRSLHQFHNWSGTLHNYTVNQLIDGGGWSNASHVYVGSDGHVYIRLDSQSSAYRMYYVEYIQYSQYNKVNAEILAITVSNSTTV